MTLIRSCLVPNCPGAAELPPDAYACPDCQARLVRKLGEIEDYLAIVSPVPGRGAPGPRAKGYESRPPLRLDVVAMLDPRTEINGDGPDDVLDEVPNIGEDLAGWWRILQEERYYRAVAGGQGMIVMPDVAAELRSNIGWICRQPWVDEFAQDVSRVHGALRQVCGDAPSKALGRCLDAGCGGEVFRRSDNPHDARLRCGRCGTSYSGLDLVRIRSAS